MKVTLTNVSVYCTASRRTLLQWRITSADPQGITFVEFFREKYLLATDKYTIPARPHCMQGTRWETKNQQIGALYLLCTYKCIPTSSLTASQTKTWSLISWRWHKVGRERQHDWNHRNHIHNSVYSPANVVAKLKCIIYSRTASDRKSPYCMYVYSLVPRPHPRGGGVWGRD